MKQTLKAKLTELNDRSRSGYTTDEFLKLAEAVRKAVSDPRYRIFARVDSVSRSGMSRTISLAIIYDGDIINLNYTPFRFVYGDSKSIAKTGGVRINGCGMDMLFEAVYRLYCYFYPYGTKGQAKPYQKHMNRYTSY